MKNFYNEYLFEIINNYKKIKFGFYLNNIDEKKYKDTPVVKDLQDFKINNNENNNEYNKIKKFIKNFDIIYVSGCCGYSIIEMRELINNLNKDNILY